MEKSPEHFDLVLIQVSIHHLLHLLPSYSCVFLLSFWLWKKKRINVSEPFSSLINKKMASLHELLAEEGFENGKFTANQRKFRSRDRRQIPLPDHDQHNIALPIYICHDWKSFDSSSSKHKPNKTILPRKGSSVFSSKRASSDSGRPNSISIEEGARRKDEQQPPIDEVAIRAVVSILSGYVGRYLKDETFRKSIKEKCYSCLTRSRNNDSDDGIFANFELGIESIENLVETSPGTKKELRMKSMRNSIRLLSIVASLNSQSSRNASTCGIPNSHLSACAQLYLSIVYKLEKNDRICARHLLQVFCDSPFLARSHLLPDLWEHFFLPHLLHLKIWYSKEVEFVSNLENAQKGNKLRALSKVYNDQMDVGTTQFALYYKEWLKVGSQPPPVPSIPLPSGPSFGSSRRKSLDPFTSHSPSNKSL